MKNLPGPSKTVQEELTFIAPILGTNQKIYDRLTLAQEIKLGLSMYTPSAETQKYLKDAVVHELAMILPPSLVIKKCALDDFTGEVGQKIQCNF